MTELLHISKSYDGKPVLRDVSLSLREGITCLMGISGRGKTTLLRILMGLEIPDAGQVLNRPERMAVQFQEDRLVETMTVGRNLKTALGRDYDCGKAEECLVSLGLPDSQHLPVISLSGGMKRRISLARALLYPAPLLVLDEPFQGLDQYTRRLAVEAIRRGTVNRAALVVIHEPEVSALLEGRIVKI